MVAWGSSEYGQLGLSTNEIFNPHPKTVKIEDNTHIIRSSFIIKYYKTLLNIIKYLI